MPRSKPGPVPPDRLLGGLSGGQLSSEERFEAERLRKRLPYVLDEPASAGRPPTTLVHGDFHPGNWRSDGRRRLIVDWADSYRGHPAADLERLLGWLPSNRHAAAIGVWAARQHIQYPSCSGRSSSPRLTRIGSSSFA
ncbi:phosphotransferase [Kribbella sp. CA-294648]|uniref:phosphotransferase n=1 Tax=Kribbella sp. CA-294648 TaxID=3239948 RepID=UPI003D941ACE